MSFTGLSKHGEWLFADDPEVIKSPMCPFEKHCGSKAEVVSVEQTDRCVNTHYRCLSCGATGLQSARKDLC